MSDEDSCTSIKKNIPNQSCQLSERVSICYGVGKQPVYMVPKNIVSQKIFSQQDFNSEGEFNSSIMPKFHVPTLQPNSKILNQTDLVSQNQSNLLQSQQKVQKQSLILIAIIWLAYLLGSIQKKSNSLSPWHFIDIIGNLLALYILIKVIYNAKRILVEHVFYISSIILTITFLAYTPAQKQDPFVSAICILKSFRLLFPIFVMFDFFKIFSTLGAVFNKVKKITFSIIILIIILSLITFQMYSSALHNQCRSESVPKNQNWMLIGDQRLCGSRSCPMNSFCRNPQQLQLKLNVQQIQTEYLGYGFYQFNNLFQSLFTNFQIVSLNSWSQVSLMFFDSYSPWLGSLVFVSSVFIIQIMFILLIIVFFDYHQQNNQKAFTSQKSGKNSPASSKEVDKFKQSQNQKDKRIILDQIQSRADLMSKRSLILNQEKQKCFQQSSPFKLQQQKNTQNLTLLRIFKYFLAICFVFSHIVLAFSFGLQDKNIQADLKNRLIGLILCIIYIIQSFSLGIVLLQFDLIDQSEKQQKIQDFQNHQRKLKIQHEVLRSIINLQVVIWISLTLDYIARILQHKYLIEQKSYLTSFAHFTLCLRIYYVFIIFGKIFQNSIFLNQLLITFRIFKSIFIYVLIMTCICCTAAAISFNINTEKFNSQTEKLLNLQMFVLEINRFFMFFVNDSWYNFLFFGKSIYSSSALNMTFLVIFSILGELIFIKFIISSIIFHARDQCLKIQQISRSQTDQKKKSSFHTVKNLSQSKHHYSKTYKQFQAQKIITDQEVHLQKQKSFFIFDHKNCLRNFAIQTIRNQYFKDVIRFRFYLIYSIMTVFGIVALDLISYRVLSAILESFVIFDMLLHMIGLRVFGPYSFINGNISQILNVAATILIYFQIFSQIFIQTLPTLQLTKIFIILVYFQSIRNILQFLKQCVNFFLRSMLILLPIFLGISIMIYPQQFQNQSTLSAIQNLLNSFNYSLILSIQKGRNLKNILNTNTLTEGNVQFIIFFINLTKFAFSTCLLYSVSGILLSKLKHKEQQQQREMGQKLFDNKMVQQQKIRRYILSLNPQFQQRNYEKQGFLFAVCSNKIYEISQSVCIIGAVFSFLFLNAFMSIQHRIIVYSFHLFFLTFQIGLFAIKSIAYNQSQNHFLRDLILIIIAVPGAYIGFVPSINYSSQPAGLTSVLLFFNILTVFRFLKIIQKFSFFKSMIRFVYQKTRDFQCIVLIFFCLGFSLASFHYLLFERNISIFQSINYIFAGIFGGDFYNSIIILANRYKIQSQYKLHFLLFLIHMSHYIVYNCMIAFLIFQISDFGKEDQSQSNTTYSLFNFKKYLHEQKLLEQWKKLDPKGTGLTNYRNILYKNHRFFECFSVSKIPYKGIQNRIINFKDLNLPVYELHYIVQQEQSQKPINHKQYVVFFYDFLYLMSRIVFQQMRDSKLINKKNHFTFNQNYIDQPPSMININSTQKHLSIASSQKTFKQQYRDYLQQWKKQSLQKARQKLRQFNQNHSQISYNDSYLRVTNLKTSQLYNAFKMIHKIKKFQMKIPKKDQSSLSNI